MLSSKVHIDEAASKPAIIPKKAKAIVRVFQPVSVEQSFFTAKVPSSKDPPSKVALSPVRQPPVHIRVEAKAQSGNNT